jgi:hypothetical protein
MEYRMRRAKSPVTQSKNVVPKALPLVRTGMRLKPSPKCHDVPHRATNQPVSRLPRPKVVRIQARYIAGENQTHIANAEGCDRETVSRIVKSSEMADYIEQMTEEFRGLVPDALSVIRFALQVQKDARIAYEVLRNVGVAPQKGERLQLPDSRPQTGIQRQAEMIANLILEGNKNFGIALPEGFEQALAEDSPTSQGAKTPSLIAPGGKP